MNIPILDSFTPENIIDLGANIGMSSLYLADRFPDAKIIGVEPDGENGEMLKKSSELSQRFIWIGSSEMWS